MLFVTFHNDGTGNQDTASYNVKVSVNGLAIAEERIEGHRRADGWRELVRMLAEGEGVDMEEPRIVYIGQLRWRYRWAEAWRALGVVWNALRGYEQTVEWTGDEPGVSLAWEAPDGSTPES